MKMEILIITIISEIILIISFIISAIYPSKRIWPPPKRKSWQYMVIWIPTYISIAGIILLTILDWDTFIIEIPLRHLIGGILLIGGLLFGLWGVLALGTYASQGLKYKLVTDGPYKYSRNPQYVGDSIAIVGVILIANSLYVTITGILGIIAFLLAPYAEEPWLREQYGEEYIEYCKKVRRYL
jgi:protein-S-isoprenylcysteine O-methyltransferase Ste14